MDPNTNPLGAAPAPAPVPTPDPAPAPAPAPAEPAAPASDAMADLGNLANELSNYDPTAELAAMAEANSGAPAAAPTDGATTPVDPVAPADDMVAPLDPSIAPAMSADPTMNPASMAAPAVDPNLGQPAVTPSPLDNIAPIAPENPNPVNLTPISDDINPVTTASAAPTMPSPDLAAPNVAGPDASAPAMPAPDMTTDMTTSGMPASDMAPAPEMLGVPTDPNAPAPAPAPVPEGPVHAAAPVPGSIGSAKSYSDIQREEAERAAKAAAAAAAKRNGKKFNLSPTTIILAAAIIVVAIIGIVIVVVSSNSTPKTKPQEPSTPVVNVQPAVTRLICSIEMKQEEFAGMPGVLSAKRVNTFTFDDEILSSLKTEQIYYMDSTESAAAAKKGYDDEHPASAASGALDTPTSSDTSSSVAETTRDSMETISTTASGATYTFTRYVSDEHIDDWLQSEFYDDAYYGLIPSNPTQPDDSRTIEGYTQAQVNGGYKCTTTKE